MHSPRPLPQLPASRLTAHSSGAREWARSWLHSGLVVSSAALLGGVLMQAWMLGRATRRGLAKARRARAFEVHPPHSRARVLLLGDSTGVGVGAGDPRDSLAGLLAAEYPGVEIVNRCRNGAVTADLLEQVVPLLVAGERFDLVLILAGGNDVLQGTPQRRLARHAHVLLNALDGLARRVVWLGSANIGASPVLLAPLSWWASWRTGRTMRLLERVVRRSGADFVNFFHPRGSDPITRSTDIYFADDGLHPTAASYRYSFEQLKQQAPIKALLTRRPILAAVPLRTPEQNHAERV